MWNQKLNVWVLGENDAVIDIFPVTMAFRSFRFRMKFSRLDDIRKMNERKRVDKLAAVAITQKYYSIGQYTTIDEMLLAVT